MPEELAAADREMLLKEADWIQEDAKGCWAALLRLQALYATATYIVIGWVLGKILHEPIQADVIDSAFWGLRNRADIALAACAMPLVQLAFTVLAFETGARWLALHVQLSVLATRLGSATHWDWTARVSGMRIVRVWRFTHSLVLGGLVSVLTLGFLWFVYPAVHSSTILLACWWTSLVMLVLSVVVSIGFSPPALAYLLKGDPAIVADRPPR